MVSEAEGWAEIFTGLQLHLLLLPSGHEAEL